MLQELAVAVTGSVPGPVTGSRYGHPVPGPANTHTILGVPYSTKYNIPQKPILTIKAPTLHLNPKTL